MGKMRNRLGEAGVKSLFLNLLSLRCLLHNQEELSIRQIDQARPEMRAGVIGERAPWTKDLGMTGEG